MGPFWPLGFMFNIPSLAIEELSIVSGIIQSLHYEHSPEVVKKKSTGTAEHLQITPHRNLIFVKVSSVRQKLTVR